MEFDDCNDNVKNGVHTIDGLWTSNFRTEKKKERLLKVSAPLGGLNGVR